MKINILGSQGGITKESDATSILIDDKLLLDAGSVASALSLEAQLNIDYILISHCHLDHIKDLAFLCDNCFGMREKPFEVYASKETIAAIKNHLFNDVLWPDFSILPNKENPIVRFNEIVEDEKICLGNYIITPCSVTHVEGSLGFIINNAKLSAVFTFDTMATEKIWKESAKELNLKAIFTEVSFPDSLQQVADASCHHTPSTLKEEIRKMPQDIPIFISHLKPQFHEKLIEEIHSIGCDRLRVLSEDRVIVEL